MSAQGQQRGGCVLEGGGRWHGGRKGLSALLVLLSWPVFAQNAAVQVDINVGSGRHAISPLIYGVAHATQEQLGQLNAPLNRRGGNATSRYNWQLNADNRGADFYFESQGYPSDQPGAVVDDFITTTRAAGAEPLVTIPMVGWVARLAPGRAKMCSFSIAKYGEQQDRDWGYFTDAGNGVLSSGQNVTNDPQDANVQADANFQKGWVQHLRERWGTAPHGGVRYYLMDNEPSLWFQTHRDVHPTGATMDEVRDKTLAYSAAVKSVDPQALVMGPEEWGWSGYLYSGYDHQAAPQTGYSHFPDREAHAGWDYIPWLLDQLNKNQQATGQRLLDVLTVHYYPQGGEFSSDTSTAMQLRRNRSTRSLWDPAYVDETWINDKVMLVPRLKGWVAQYYPGTQVGITEYNWGAEGHINGALAQADILGIFGREGLDYATRWETPAATTPTFKAMQLFRNYDGQKSTFGDVSVTCAVPDPDTLSAFAAQRTSDGALTVLVLNKALSGDTPVTLHLQGFTPGSTATRWQLTSANTLTHLTSMSLASGVLSTTVPAQSLTLFVIASSTDSSPPPGGGTPVNQPPRALIKATPTSGQASLTVSVDATGSTDPDGTLTAYVWDFGDGQQGSGATASHTYSQAGTYTLQLTVTDDGGATASATVPITVSAAPATPPPQSAPSSHLVTPSSFYAQRTGTEVALHWTDNSSSEQGFIIERCVAQWPMDFQEVGRVSAQVTSFVDTAVPPGSYYYRVKAYAGMCSSEYSNMDGV